MIMQKATYVIENISKNELVGLLLPTEDNSTKAINCQVSYSVARNDGKKGISAFVEMTNQYKKTEGAYIKSFLKFYINTCCSKFAQLIKSDCHFSIGRFTGNTLLEMPFSSQIISARVLFPIL